ncbi:hypothetical protein PAPHI01_0484 [Pancytospora philotis]|nr:hypothetical protein PAPHI01_0484 [Pancytospora philotis]
MSSKHSVYSKHNLPGLVCVKRKCFACAQMHMRELVPLFQRACSRGCIREEVAEFIERRISPEAYAFIRRLDPANSRWLIGMREGVKLARSGARKEVLNALECVGISSRLNENSVLPHQSFAEAYSKFLSILQPFALAEYNEAVTEGCRARGPVPISVNAELMDGWDVDPCILIQHGGLYINGSYEEIYREYLALKSFQEELRARLRYVIEASGQLLYALELPPLNDGRHARGYVKRRMMCTADAHGGGLDGCSAALSDSYSPYNMKAILASNTITFMKNMWDSKLLWAASAHYDPAPEVYCPFSSRYLAFARNNNVKRIRYSEYSGDARALELIRNDGRMTVWRTDAVSSIPGTSSYYSGTQDQCGAAAGAATSRRLADKPGRMDTEHTL